MIFSNNSSFIKKFLSILIAFSTCLIIMFLTTVFIINNTLFNKSFIVKNLQHSDYIETCAEQIRNNMEKLGKDSGFSSDFFMTIASKDNVECDILNSFEKLYNNEDEDHSSDFEDMLYGKFVEYGTSNGYKITEGVSDNLHKLASFCGQIYASHTSIPCNAQIRALIEMEKNFFGVYVLIGLTLLLFMIIILVLINRKKLHELTKLLIAIFAGSCLSFSLILTSSKIFNVEGNIPISNIVFKNFAKKCYCEIWNEFLIILINFAIIFVLLVVFYIFLTKVYGQKNKQKYVKLSN